MAPSFLLFFSFFLWVLVFLFFFSVCFLRGDGGGLFFSCFFFVFVFLWGWGGVVVLPGWFSYHLRVTTR